MGAVRGRVCVVTGAGSGIGRAVAIELGKRGVCGLALCDVNEAGLAETAARVRDGIEVHCDRVDVSNREQVKDYAATVASRFPAIHQVYNNAGVAGDQDILDPRNHANLERMINVNLWGVIHGTVEFLPHLIRSGLGHIVNVSSLNGLAATPRQIGYCASKFGVRGFSEALYTDLLLDRHPVKVSVVYPSGIRTNIATAALNDIATSTPQDEMRADVYNQKFLTMDVAVAATAIVDGVERNRTRIRVGREARVLDRVVRLFPGEYPKFIVSGLRKTYEKIEAGK